MKNPARELAVMLDEWTIPARVDAIDHRRSVAAGKDSTLHEEMKRATHLLSLVEQDIVRLRARGHDVADFEEALTRWAESIYSIDEGWSNVATISRAVVGAGDLRLLRSLAITTDVAGGSVQLGPESIEKVEAAITDAEDFIKGAEEIRDSLRLHLLGLLAAIREAVENGRADQAGPLVAEFIGTTSLTAEVVPEPHRSAWRQKASDWVLQFSANVAAGDGIPLVASSATAAIQGLLGS